MSYSNFDAHCSRCTLLPMHIAPDAHCSWCTLLMMHIAGMGLNIKWTKSAQTINCTPLVPIPTVQGAITDPLSAYRELLLMCPTRYPQDHLLLLPNDKGRKVVTITHLRNAFTQLLEQVGLSTSKYSLHSLRRGEPPRPSTLGCITSMLKDTVCGPRTLSGDTSPLQL